MASLAVMAEPPARHVDGAMMDYFMIELVNTVRESSAVAMVRAKKVEQEMVESGLLPPPAPPGPLLPLKDNPRDSLTSIASRNSASAKANPASEAEEAVRVRLEAIGMHVGANFTERLCLEKMLFSETLDAVKFICKDIWTACWDKQVDNLRTNHRGVYVLQDNSFKSISHLSSWKGREDALQQAKMYVALPAGIIKGALSRLGYNGSVAPEVTSLPQCKFCRIIRIRALTDRLDQVPSKSNFQSRKIKNCVIRQILNDVAISCSRTADGREDSGTEGPEG